VDAGDRGYAAEMGPRTNVAAQRCDGRIRRLGGGDTARAVDGVHTFVDFIE